MKLKVVFTFDPTGMTKDIEEEIEVPSDTCLFCCHDSRHSILRLKDEVQKSLERKGYDFTYYYTFYLFKVYVV